MERTKVNLLGIELSNPVIPASGTFGYGREFAGLYDLDILGFIDPEITVNIIKDGALVEKKHLTLPKQIRDVLKCKNPRCITSVEQELPHIFNLTDPRRAVYRCAYCETKAE